MDLRGRVAIAGIGESDVGVVPGRSSLALHADAAAAALDDAGLTKEDVDAVLTNGSYYDYHVRHAMAFAEYFGIPAAARLVDTIPLGSGATSGLFLHQAASLILSGAATTVLAVSADSLLSACGRDESIQRLAGQRDKEFEAPYAPILPACFALVARRYMHETGLTERELASVAVTMRDHGSRNTRAHMRQRVTVDEVLDSPMIADPLHRLDCSLISDGGAAVILTGADRARDLLATPVYILGAANCHGTGQGRLYSTLAQSTDLTRPGTVLSARLAMEQAGVTHADIDVIGCYDPFSIMPILLLEAAGFFERGTAGSAAAEGALGVEGTVPVNPHGGLLSYAHPGNPGAFFMITEMVRQLRHDAENQVGGAEVAMVLGYGGEFAFWPCTVLSTSA